jgi:hypothetical protein
MQLELAVDNYLRICSKFDAASHRVTVHSNELSFHYIRHSTEHINKNRGPLSLYYIHSHIELL